MTVEAARTEEVAGVLGDHVGLELVVPHGLHAGSAWGRSLDGRSDPRIKGGTRRRARRQSRGGEHGEGDER